MAFVPPSISGETIRRSTVFSLLAEAVRAGAAAALILYLVHALDPGGFGVLSLASGIGIIAAMAADFGTSGSASRFVAERVEDPDAVAAVVSDGLRVKLLISVAVGVGLLLLASPIADAYHEPALAGPLRVVAAATFAQSLFQLYVAVAIGLRRNAVQAWLYTVEGLTETVTAIALVALGGGATGALLGRTAGYALAAVLGAMAIRRAIGRPVRPWQRGGYGRRIAAYAGPLIVVNAAFTLFDQIDVLLVGAYLGATAAGQFQAAVRLALLLSLPGQAVSNAVAPRISDGPRDGGRVATLQLTLRVLTGLGVPVMVAVMVWSRPLVHLVLGSRYAPAADVLLASGPFVVMGFVAPVITVAVTFLGYARQRVPIAIGTVILQVVLDVALIPLWGIVGPAIATDISFGIYTGLHLHLLARILGLDLRPTVRTLARSLFGGALMAGVLLLAGTGTTLPVSSWVLGALGGTVAYGLGLLVTGEVTPAEIRAARALRRRPADATRDDA